MARERCPPWLKNSASHISDRYDHDVDGEPGRRWLTLTAGTIALTAGCTFQYGLAYLIPALRASGLSLEEAGGIVACPTAGLLLTLVAWGAAADRFGERLVLASGLAAAGVVLLVASGVHETAALAGCLVAAGAAGGSVYAASGRLILGWFAASQRGLAMGIRQSAQPLGVAVAAVSLPTLAAHGLSAGLAFLGTFCLAAVLLVIVVVRDPVHQARAGRGQAGSPYRGPAQRARVHRGGRVRRAAVGGPCPGHPEHRAEPDGGRDAAGHRHADRGGRVRGRLRRRRGPAAGRRGAGPRRGAGGYRAAGVRPAPTAAGSAPSWLRARSSHHRWPSAGRVWIGS